MPLMVFEFLWCTCLTAVPTRGRYVYLSLRCGACLLTRLTCLRSACLRRYLPSSTQLWCLLVMPACGACLQCMLTVVPVYGGACLRYLPVAPAYGGACLRWYLSAPARTCLQYLFVVYLVVPVRCSLAALAWAPACMVVTWLGLPVVLACVSLYVYLPAVPACGNRLPQPRALVLPAYGTYLLSLPGSNTCLPCLPCLLAVLICLLYLLAVRLPALAFIACALCLLAVHLPVVPLLRQACLLYCVCGAWL